MLNQLLLIILLLTILTFFCILNSKNCSYNVTVIFLWPGLCSRPIGELIMHHRHLYALVLWGWKHSHHFQSSGLFLILHLDMLSALVLAGAPSLFTLTAATANLIIPGFCCKLLFVWVQVSELIWTIYNLSSFVPLSGLIYSYSQSINCLPSFCAPPLIGGGIFTCCPSVSVSVFPKQFVSILETTNTLNFVCCIVKLKQKVKILRFEGQKVKANKVAAGSDVEKF